MKLKTYKIIFISSVVLLLACVLGLFVTGWQSGWGPFGGLYEAYGDEVGAIEQRYDAGTRRGEIVFYGASNFRLWTGMESDLAEYRVQNHGFGGSTDALLVKYADRILYPYEPAVVFFLTASNDYVGLSGTDDEKAGYCMAYKREMFDSFHEALPDSVFVVMSGLYLPGRDQYREVICNVNAELAELCGERDYMFFVDASELTWDGTAYRTELFESDGIHLNRSGQILWMERYIRPEIESLIEQYGLDSLRKD